MIVQSLVDLFDRSARNARTRLLFIWRGLLIPEVAGRDRAALPLITRRAGTYPYVSVHLVVARAARLRTPGRAGDAKGMSRGGVVREIPGISAEHRRRTARRLIVERLKDEELRHGN